MRPAQRAGRSYLAPVAAMMLAGVLTATSGGSAQALTWETPTVLSTATSYTWPGSIVSFGTDGSIVAYEARSGEKWTSYLRRSEGGVATVTTLFAQPLADETSRPSLAAHGNRIDLVWVRGTSTGDLVNYQTSSDAGLTWSPRRELMKTGAYISTPSVARNAAHKVAVVWSNGRTGKVRIRVSTDDGATFRPARTVADGDDPSVAISGRTIVVAYGISREGRYDIDVRRSTDNGETWSAATRLGFKAYGAYAHAEGTTVMVGYTQSSDDFVAVRVSADAGLTWAPRFEISSSSATPSSELVLSESGGIWRAVYQQCLTHSCNADRAIRYRQSLDNGATWSPRANVTTTEPWNSPTGVAATSAGPLVVWNAFSPETGNIVELGSGTP
jgi:BNR repeat-like domain